MKKTILLLLLVGIGLPSRAEMRWIGDADGDGKLTSADVNRLRQYVLGEAELPKDITLLDVNGDKKVTIADVTRLIYLLQHPSEAIQTWVPDNIPTGGDRGSFD